jgi:hypothetical protein
MKTNPIARAHTLEYRRRSLGRKATYRKLALRTGINFTSIFQTLTGRPSAIRINRPRIMDKVEAALAEIELETS